MSLEERPRTENLLLPESGDTKDGAVESQKLGNLGFVVVIDHHHHHDSDYDGEHNLVEVVVRAKDWSDADSSFVISRLLGWRVACQDLLHW